MGVVLSRVPIEKETLDTKLANNPPYMLGRDYQASARRVLTLLGLSNYETNMSCADLLSFIA